MSPVPRPATTYPRQALAVRPGRGQGFRQPPSVAPSGSSSYRWTVRACAARTTRAGLDRLHHEELARDLLVGVTARDQPQHLALPLVSRLRSASSGGTSVAAKASARAGQSRRDHGVVLRHARLDRLDGTGAGDRFGDYRARTDHRRSHLPPGWTPTAPGPVRPAGSDQLAQPLDAAAARQVDVQHDHVRGWNA